MDTEGVGSPNMKNLKRYLDSVASLLIFTEFFSNAKKKNSSYSDETICFPCRKIFFHTAMKKILLLSL